VLIGEVVSEDAVFRIDHFLAEQTVLNLLGLRFANRVFEPVWNSLHVERVDIVWDETVGLEERAGYYDHAGALRDMVQNHLLQLLSLVAMEPPTHLGERALRDRKVDVLRAVRTPSWEEIVRGTRRGRYVAGHIGDRELPDYAAEPGVDAGRRTETYAGHLVRGQLALVGRPLPPTQRQGARSGPARDRPALPSGPAPALRQRRRARRASADPRPRRDRPGGQPQRRRRPLRVKARGARPRPGPPRPAAYSLLLLEILNGQAALSVRGDEAEESWRIVEPIIAAWTADAVPLEDYAAGSALPARARQRREG